MSIRVVLLSALVAVLAVSVVYAGGEQEDAGPEEVVLWWESELPEAQDALRELLVQQFNEENPGYKLTMEFRGELEQQLRVGLLAGEGPDIVLSNAPASVTNLVENDQLLSLNEYVDQYGWSERFVPIMLDLGTVDGDLYALPKTYETIVLFYNETLFEENGWDPPENASDIAELAPQMLEQGIVPFSGGNSDWRGANEWYVTVVLNHYAGPEKVYQALKGDIPWTDPVFVEAIEVLQSWWDKGWFSPDYYSLSLEQGFAQMASRDAAMALNGTWAFQWENAYFGGDGDDMNWAPVPRLSSDAPYPAFTLGIGTLLAISANSEVPDGAAAVLDFMTQRDFIVDINKEIPGEWNVPVTTVSASDLSEATTDTFARHVTSLSDTVAEGNYGYTTWSFWPPETNTYIYEGIEQVWLGQITAEEYMAEVDELFQEELTDGKVPPLPER
jgi:raffinose/stachyose/melibiose transport system substrate-binding protein